MVSLVYQVPIHPVHLLPLHWLSEIFTYLPVVHAVVSVTLVFIPVCPAIGEEQLAS